MMAKIFFLLFPRSGNQTYRLEQQISRSVGQQISRSGKPAVLILSVIELNKEGRLRDTDCIVMIEILQFPATMRDSIVMSNNKLNY